MSCAVRSTRFSLIRGRAARKKVNHQAPVERYARPMSKRAGVKPSPRELVRAQRAKNAANPCKNRPQKIAKTYVTSDT